MLALFGSAFACLAGDISVYVNNIGFPKKHHDVNYTLTITTNINGPDGAYEIHYDTGGTASFSVTANAASGFPYTLTSYSYVYEVSRSYAGQTVNGPGKNGSIFYIDYSQDPPLLVPAGSWTGYHGEIEVIEWPASDTNGMQTETAETVFQSLNISLGDPGPGPPPEDPPEGQTEHDGEWVENANGDGWEWAEYIKDQDTPPINPGGPGAGNWEWSEVLGEGERWIWNGTTYAENAAFVGGGGTAVPPTPYDPDPVSSGVTASSFSELTGDDLQIATASESSTQLHRMEQSQDKNTAEVVSAINQLRESNETDFDGISELLGEGTTIDGIQLDETIVDPVDVDDGTAAQAALQAEIAARTSLANDFASLPAIITGFGSFFTLQSISFPKTSTMSVTLPPLGQFYGGGQVLLDFADFSFLTGVRALLAWIVYAMCVLGSGKILMGMFG